MPRRRFGPRAFEGFECLHRDICTAPVRGAISPLDRGGASRVIRWKPTLNAFAITFAGPVRQNPLPETAGPHTNQRRPPSSRGRSLDDESRRSSLVVGGKRHTR